MCLTKVDSHRASPGAADQFFRIQQSHDSGTIRETGQGSDDEIDRQQKKREECPIGASALLYFGGIPGLICREGRWTWAFVRNLTTGTTLCPGDPSPVRGFGFVEMPNKDEADKAEASANPADSLRQ